MRWFLLIFFLIYGLYHLYFFLKARPRSPFTIPLSLWLLLMTAAPILTRMAERHGHEGVARLLAVSGYAWMGFVFEFFCIGLALDFLLVLGKIGQRCFSRTSPRLLTPKKFFLTVSLLSLTLCLYGVYEASNPRLARHQVTISKSLGGERSLTIVQISDLHLGLMIGEKFLKKVILLVAQEKPDILVATGDIVDGHGDGLASLAKHFKGLTPRLGKFAVTGNHEFYMGVINSLAFLEESGFTVLRNRTVTPGGTMEITGIDDLTAYYFSDKAETPEWRLLEKGSPDRFHLLLKHRPLVEKTSLGLFDLQLSGHVHGGQLFPFNLVTGLKFPWPAGRLVSLEKGFLYTSRGTGTWGPPMRIFAPPEITVIKVIAEGN